MKKKWLKFSARLGEVKESLFTIQGSPFYFVPKNKKLLNVMRNWPKGMSVIVMGYKMSADSNFISFAKITGDFYKSRVKAKTRRVIAYAEMDELTIERQNERRHINGKGTHTGLVGSGSKEKHKQTRGGQVEHIGWEPFQWFDDDGNPRRKL